MACLLLFHLVASDQVLNLFLALLLSSFGAESLQTSQDESEPNKLQEAIDRINRFVVFVKSHLLVCIYFRLRRKQMDDQFDPTFAKVDFGGKIWFNSAEILGNGQTAVASVVITSETELNRGSPVAGKTPKREREKKMDGWTNGWTNGRTDERTDGRTDGRIDGRTDRQTDRQTNRQTDKG